MMDSPSVQGPSRLVLRWAVLLALVLPAVAVLDAVAHGTGRQDRASGPWHARTQALPGKPPLLDARWYPPLPAAAARGHDCPSPARVPRRHGRRGRRLVALTFDDGPSPYTPSVLRTLRRHRAH